MADKYLPARQRVRTGNFLLQLGGQQFALFQRFDYRGTPVVERL